MIFYPKMNEILVKIGILQKKNPFSITEGQLEKSVRLS